MNHNGKVIYRDNKIFYNGELWDLAGVQADSDAHIKIQLEKIATSETLQVRVHADDIMFMD
jgi:hypothetical protein